MNLARPWETRLAWALRIAILLTAIGEMVAGDLAYGLFCVAALALTLMPAVMARSSHVSLPFEVELVLLWLLVTDMIFGYLLGLYLTIPWFDKVLHLSNSVLLGMVAFLAVYVLHFTGRTRQHAVIDGLAILLLTLGLGALWEIGEYGIDALLHRATQGSPALNPLDDTMVDLMLDGLGGLLGAVLGPLYMRRSRRSRRRIQAFAEAVTRRERLGGDVACGPERAPAPRGAAAGAGTSLAARE